MRSRIRGVRWIALAALVAGVVTVPSALAVSPQGSADLSGTGLWFVEFNGAPTAAGGSVATNRAQKASFRVEAKKAGVSFSERKAYDTLWNGVSIRTGADAATLKDIQGVKAVYPVGIESIPPTSEITPELSTAIQMTGADIVQSELGFDGTGVKVGVVDTGFDLDHPDLGGDGTPGAPFPNSRVTSQFDFVGDDYNADPASSAYSPTPVPDAIADDCNGHGTHVSGIVGANGSVTGVAPGVTFGAYRIFGCAGSANDDVILAALERALADGVDVVNMSLGDAFNTWPQAPLAQASDNLLKQGVVVVTSIGNSGASGVYSAGAPGVGDGVIGTASYDNTDIHNVNSALVTPAGLTVGYASMPGALAAPLFGSGSLATPTAGTAPGLGCAATNYAGFPAGSIAFVQRGVCSFAIKTLTAQAAGAVAVVIYNNTPGLLFGTLLPSTAAIPAVGISLADGNTIVAAMAGGLQTWNWTSNLIDVPNVTGGTISSFSSLGLNAELTLKPDIGAPGGLIRSTYPIENGSYTTLNGTSMASPHVAGAVALLLEAHPNTKPGDVRDILQNSADPKNRFGQTYLDPTHKQGAGMLDIDDAILATTLVQPGKISLGEGNGGTRTITLRNSSGSPVTYTVSHEPAAGTTNTFPAIAYSTAFSTVSFSRDSITVPGNGTANLRVAITPSGSLPDKAVYGGYIKFTPQGGGQEYRVPYAGFKGDYQSIAVMTPNAQGFPFLSRLVGCTQLQAGQLNCFAGGSYDVIPDDTTNNVFSFADPFNVPHFLFHLDHQARSLTGDVYRVSGNKWMGTGMTMEFLARNSGATTFFAFPWDGKAKKGEGQSLGNAGPVADGTYYMKFELVKALGSKQQTETWTSPNFVIDRP